MIERCLQTRILRMLQSTPAKYNTLTRRIKYSSEAKFSKHKCATIVSPLRPHRSTDMYKL